MGKGYMGTNIKTDNIIQPYFVIGGKNRKEKIRSFPGQYRFSVDTLINDIGKSRALGINKILLFGIPDSKDKYGSTAYGKDNLVSLAVKRIKQRFPDIIVFTDVCLCAYTDHGHCGVLKRRASGVGRRAANTQYAARSTKYELIDNKATLKALAKMAVAHAEAGADYVAPSAMTKGQVGAIRKALDKNGYHGTGIMGYSAKFASNFYRPFRNAAGSSPKFGDRSSYQLDYASAETALREIQDDIEEGADIVMVKPAIAYLDIIYRAKQKFGFPLAAYNVSGEYALLKDGLRYTGSKEKKGMLFEILTAIKRAGADYIITYHAREIAKWLITKN